MKSKAEQKEITDLHKSYSKELSKQDIIIYNLKKKNAALIKCIKTLDAAGGLALHCGDNGLYNFVELMLMNTKKAIKENEL